MDKEIRKRKKSQKEKQFEITVKDRKTGEELEYYTNNVMLCVGDQVDFDTVEYDTVMKLHGANLEMEALTEAFARAFALCNHEEMKDEKRK